MTGPEHYREAERLMGFLKDAGDVDTRIGEAYCAAAQVHATLALVAATALNDADGGNTRTEWDAWNEAAGTKPKAQDGAA